MVLSGVAVGGVVGEMGAAGILLESAVQAMYRRWLRVWWEGLSLRRETIERCLQDFGGAPGKVPWRAWSCHLGFSVHDYFRTFFSLPERSTLTSPQLNGR